MQKIRYGFDMDDVLCDMMTAFLDFVNKEKILDYQISIDDVSGPYFFTDGSHLPRQRGFDLRKQFVQQGGVFARKPIPGSQTKLAQLKADGHEIFVITARMDFEKQDTIRYLDTYYRGLVDDIYFAPHASGMRKSEISTKLALDVFVDDHIDNCMDVSNVCKNVYLMDKPWNRKHDLAESAIQRISCLTDLKD